MNYAVARDTFTKITETTGTLQNASKITTVEVSDEETQGSGVLVPPLEKISFDDQVLYVRCVDGAGAEVRVVPFEVEQRGGGSGIGTITLDGNVYRIATNAEIAAMLDDNFGMED